MKKLLLLLTLAFSLHHFAQAQTTCRIDTILNYSFIDGSTTKTSTGRTIYSGPEVQGGDGSFRSSLSQDFKNGSYVNSYKEEVVPHLPSGGYSEYASSNWDSASASWKPEYKENLTFNASNKITERISQEPDQSGTLTNTRKDSYTYNAKGKATSYVRQNWVNGAWRNLQQNTSTFQADTLETLFLRQTWDTTSSSWTNVEKTERTFNANAKETETSQYQWNVGTSAWKGIQREMFVYNPQGLRIEREIMSWDLGTSAFIKFFKTLFVYNNAGSIISETFQYWNSVSGIYETSEVRTNTYNANNVLISARATNLNTTTGLTVSASRTTITLNSSDKQLVFFSEDSSAAAGGAWRPFRKWTYTYDANGNKTSELSELRQLGDTLSNSYRQSSTYNANNQLLTNAYDSWILSTSSWSPNYSSLDEYNSDGFRTANEFASGWNTTGNYFNSHSRREFQCTLVSVGILSVVNANISIYPNPTNNILNIQIDATIEAISVYNFQGQNVLNVSNTNQLDLSNLAEGAYIVQINTDKGTARKTIIKQ